VRYKVIGYKQVEHYKYIGYSPESCMFFEYRTYCIYIFGVKAYKFTVESTL